MKLFSYFKKILLNLNKIKYFKAKSKFSSAFNQIKIPDHFIIPLNQNLNKYEEEGDLCVKSGDKVLRGQPLTFFCNGVTPIHAPTSGKIISITSHPVAYPTSITTERCIIIKSDRKDLWIERNPWKNYYKYSRKDLINRIYQYGINKFKEVNSLKDIEFDYKNIVLIINTIEFSPYIKTNDYLIQKFLKQIIDGIQILNYILQPIRIIIIIEKHKKKTISMLRAISKNFFSRKINLSFICIKSFSRNQKQLIQILIKQKIINDECLLGASILIQDIRTIYSIKRAVIDGEPVTERIITITKKSALLANNIFVRLGTTAQYLLDKLHLDNNQVIIMDHPLINFTVLQANIPIMKTTHYLLILPKKELTKIKYEYACCDTFYTNICPMNLLVQKLYFFIKKNQFSTLNYYNNSDEYEYYNWICPNNIFLSNFFYQKKEEIFELFMKKIRDIEANYRSKARRIRLKNQKTIKVFNKNNSSKKFLEKNSKKDAILAAISRVKAKKNAKKHDKN